jgi:hypothetical protein
LKQPVELLSTPGEEFGQDLRESEPEDLLPGSGRKKSSLKYKCYATPDNSIVAAKFNEYLDASTPEEALSFFQTLKL